MGKQKIEESGRKKRSQTDEFIKMISPTYGDLGTGGPTP